VLKNSKTRLLHFFANFHCAGKVDTNCPERTMTAFHIAKPVFWPPPWPKIPIASQPATFSPIFGKTGVFQHNQPNLFLGIFCCVRTQHGFFCTCSVYDAAWPQK
jgi:hypothetical protein